MYRLPCSLCSFSIETSSTQNQSASTSYLGHRWLILLDEGSGKPASPSLDTASAISNISCLNKDSHWHANIWCTSQNDCTALLWKSKTNQFCVIQDFGEKGRWLISATQNLWEILLLQQSRKTHRPEFCQRLHMWCNYLGEKKKSGVLECVIYNACFQDECIVSALNQVCTRKGMVLVILFCSADQEVLLNLKKNCAKWCLFS